MEPSARHRTTRPTRLIAVVTAVLLAAGVALVTGSASAHSSNERVDKANASRDDDSGSGLSRFFGGRRSDRDNDRDRDGRDNGDGDNRKDRDRGRDGDDNRDRDDDRDRNNDDDKDKDRKKDDGKKDDDEEFPGRDKIDQASDDDFIDIRQVRTGEDLTKERRRGSSGSFVARCGTNENRHNNSDNFMVAPGKRNGAQHVHDYVGNLSTDAFSTDDSLHAAGTTCDRNNKSTFFWPVIRDTRGRDSDVRRDGGGRDGNVGRILRPVSADLRFLGSDAGPVDAMPDDLAIITGDAKRVTNGDKNEMSQWTCTGFTNRVTEKYPICPSGSKMMRIIDFPNCWDGKHLDSKDHRTHTAFADDDGDCRRGFRRIPQLRMTLTYAQPPGRDFALDTFPDQQHDPRTDHADFMNIASDDVLRLMRDCINSGRTC